MAPEDSQYLDKYNTPFEGEPNRIIVIGVGGGGNNAVDHMFRQDVDHVSFVVVNTDRQALESAAVPNKVLIGPNVTRGRGAGNKPERAREAAEESAADIERLFTDDTDMVFVTAGMGGGTGTGAAPVVARIAKEKGLLTIGIVTIPFVFEGMRKIQKAITGAEEMKKYVDAMMIVNNERLVEIYPDFEFESAFAKADDILSTAASSIAEIITRKGYINLDFNDVDTTLREGGTAIIAVGYGEGENRVTKAIQDALHSPLLRHTDVLSSKRILFNLYYSRNANVKFKASEAKELNDFINRVEEEVDVIWGITYDESLGDKVKFTILASGFDVTVDDGKVIQGEAAMPAAAVDAPINLDVISELYGTEKIEKITRDKETQNYIILSGNQIDDDSAIDRFEKSPTFTRDKRLSSPAPKPEAKPASDRYTTPGTSATPGAFSISFSDDD